MLVQDNNGVDAMPSQRMTLAPSLTKCLLHILSTIPNTYLITIDVHTHHIDICTMFDKNLHHFRVTITGRLDEGHILQNHHGSTRSHVLSTRLTLLSSPFVTSLHILSIIRNTHLDIMRCTNPIDMRPMFYKDLHHFHVTIL